MVADLSRIQAAVEEDYGQVQNFWGKLVLDNFLQGSVYYCEFQRPADTAGQPPQDDFCYAFDNKTKILIFDDGTDVIKNDVSKEFMAIFSLIAGYYFGKNIAPGR